MEGSSLIAWHLHVACLLCVIYSLTHLLPWVSSSPGLYRILARDATEIFSIEPLPAPPPMITSVTDSYLHVRHHHHHKRRNKTQPSGPNDVSINEPESSDNIQVNDDKFDCWDGVMQPDERMWVDTSKPALSRDSPEHIDSPTIDKVPAFRSITAFTSELELSAKPSPPELELGEKETKQQQQHHQRQQSCERENAEATFQQQLQIKGINGLKKEALKKFLSGSWKLSEEDSLWVPDEFAWYCRKCSEQFSLFKRKHHCRR
jgi:hypothetical protein